MTLCVHAREHLFGEVVNEHMQLTPYGRVAATYWQRIPRHFPRVTLGAWVVMPNHLHGIIVITANDASESNPPPPPMENVETLEFLSATDSETPILQAGALGAIVGNYKSITARRINQMRHTPGAPVWLRNYYERIIRDAKAWEHISTYIENNPSRWEKDSLYVEIQ